MSIITIGSVSPQDVFNSLPLLDTSRSAEWAKSAQKAVDACVSVWEARAKDPEALKSDMEYYRGAWKIRPDNYVETKGDSGIISPKDMPWVAHVNALLAQRIRFRSNADVALKLDKMAEFLEDRLGNEPYSIICGGVDFDPYHDGYRGAGSKDWFASLLYDRMRTNKPQCVGSQVTEKNTVIIDDCSYSGLQLETIVNGVFETVDQGRYSQRYSAAKVPVVYILVPYMTQTVWDKLLKKCHAWEKTEDDKSVTFERSDLRCVLWKPEMIPETMKELEVILERFPDVSTARKNGVRNVRRKWKGYINGAALFFFEHKFPDFVSFPDDFVFVKLYLAKLCYYGDDSEVYKSKDLTQVADRKLACAEKYEERRRQAAPQDWPRSC